MDAVCRRLPWHLGNTIARIVHRGQMEAVLCDVRTRVIRISATTPAFYICTTDNYYATLLAVAGR